MAHQFVHEPLRAGEADRLANASQTVEEKLIVRTLLDTGLRVPELCSLTASDGRRPANRGQASRNPSTSR
jgi:hypothetical protein